MKDAGWRKGVLIGVVLLLAVEGVRGETPMDYCVGWWRFDRGCGSTAWDCSGKGNHGLLDGGPTWVCQSLRFDGQDDNVVVEPNDPCSLDFSQDFTWLAIVSTVSGGTIMSKSPSAGAITEGVKTLYIDLEGYVVFEIPGIFNLCSTVEVNDGVMHMVGVTADFDSADSNDTFKLYVNLELEDVIDVYDVNSTEDGMDLRFGVTTPNFPNPNDGANSWFEGRIGNAYVFNRALSESEIESLFLAPTCTTWYEWHGVSSGDWFDSNNWQEPGYCVSPPALPTEEYDVRIKDFSADAPVVSGGAAACKELQVGVDVNCAGHSWYESGILSVSEGSLEVEELVVAKGSAIDIVGDGVSSGGELRLRGNEVEYLECLIADQRLVNSAGCVGLVTDYGLSKAGYTTVQPGGFEPIVPADFIGDCRVDLVDFAVLGASWMSEPNQANWNAACDISEPNDSVIDGRDLKVFAEMWLAGL